ncbi:MAG: AbiV family abortive infection protein [Nitrospirota bacterium]
MSIEERAKIEMIGAWATSQLMGKGIDLETAASGFRSHKSKNHTNTYMARLTEEELEARKRGDWEESVAVDFRTAFIRN